MEIDEDIHDPESNFVNLLHQVEEQTEFCDVTVRFGDWARKFHRCVLSASLLFQTMINTQNSETEKGNDDTFADTSPKAQLEITFDTSPEIVEMAMMFMYGVIPDFDIRNIGDFLELAEYLKLKDLTEACADWLDNIDYSEVSCVYVIRLSRKYKFEITSCIEYIESHIPETFLHADAVDLPTDFICHLFTDLKFSYVDMDDKLNFLVKLANIRPTPEETVVQLFKTINWNDVSECAWENAKEDENFSGIINLGNTLRPIAQDNSKHCIMIIPSVEDYFACLDLQNDIWYRLNSSYFERYSYGDEEIIGIRNNNPEIYFKSSDDWSDDIVLTSVDLECDQMRRNLIGIELVGFVDGEILDIDITHVNFTNDTLVTVVKKTIQMYESSISSESESESESEYESESRNEGIRNTNGVFQVQASPRILSSIDTDNRSSLTYAQAISIYEPSTSSLRMSSSKCQRDRLVTCTEVSVGNALDAEGEEVEMHPLFSFRTERITQICVNDQSVLALLTKSGSCLHVILYDLLQYKMKRIFTMLEKKYELCATDNGFLLHNNTHCYCFTRLATPVYSGNYKIEEFMFDNNEGLIVKYKYQCGIWMRILRRSTHNDVELQYISHEQFTASFASLDVKWKNVSMPKDKFLLEKIKNFENVFIVSLSKRKLRCNIACPHCKDSYCSQFFYV